MIPNYLKIDDGTIKQIDVKPYTYNAEYVDARYNQYEVLCDMMSHLRYGFIVGSIGRIPESILDVGYGNGSFLKITSNAGIESFGTDVSNYPLEHGTYIDFATAKSKEIDVITFFDSLEHFSDLDFLSDLKCKYACISVPNCNYNLIEMVFGTAEADKYFTDWKHRREDEHIWHFDATALMCTMSKYGYSAIKFAYIEDIIRKPVDDYHNILTMIFEKTND